MADHVDRVTGIDKAAETNRGLDWFEVTEIGGHLDEGSIAHFQVIELGFPLRAQVDREGRGRRGGA